MGRLIAITAFALFVTVPLSAAQRGGGHTGGSRGGFGGSRAGFVGRGGVGAGHTGGGHFSAGMRSRVSPGFTLQSRRNFSRGPSGRNGFHRGFRNHGFRNCSGFGCRGRFGYSHPYWAAGYYDPWRWSWWGDSGSSYDEDYARDRAIASEMNRQNLEEQHMLRQEDAENDRDDYTQRSPRSRSNAGSNYDPELVISPTVLVFRDQHQKQIRNYAIIGPTLWNFAPQHTERISIADLDVSATVKVNEDRGVNFRVPGVIEGR